MDIADMAEGAIRLALAEDLGTGGDVTTAVLVPAGMEGTAHIVAKAPCRMAGGPVAERVFALVEPQISFETLVPDGDDAAAGRAVARLRGPLAGILTGERTALNFLCHMCGIATVTSRLAEMARPHGVDILDTRKTTPGLRALEKYAVAMGGGVNHRMGLFDAVLIKDNHIAASGGLEPAVRKARNALGDRFEIEVEAASLAQVREAVAAGANIIMLDNMDPGTIEKALALIDGRARTEVSGGVGPENLASYLMPGVDSISLGFLTHSAPAADLSLEVEAPVIPR
ncbi:MAG: carboxylating nicotinate-nucleotide diphosphorylase [Actinomycetota bacterium]